MKKIFTAAFLSMSLFAVACSEVDKTSENPTQPAPQEVVEYDTSSPQAFKDSFEDQCEKDGVSRRDVEAALRIVMYVEYKKNIFEINEIEDHKTAGLAHFNLIKKSIGNKSPEGLIAYSKKLCEKCNAYDYSSFEDFTVSGIMQCVKYDVDFKVFTSALAVIGEKEFKAEIERIEAIEDEEEKTRAGLKSAEKVIANRSPKEIVEYATSLGYDYSSRKIFKSSCKIQCLKYGIDTYVFSTALDIIAKKEFKAEYDRIEAIEDEELEEKEYLGLRKKVIANRNPKEIIKYTEELVAYDYSSEEAFMESLELQCELTYVRRDEVENAISIIKNKEFAGEEDSLALMEKIIANRNPSELMEYAKRLGYDYSSAEAFELSFEFQCKSPYVDIDEVENAISIIKNKEFAGEEGSLALMEKIIANRNPSELMEYAKGLGYDYSSEEAFDLSFEFQCKSPYVSRDEIENAISIIKNKEFAGAEDSLELKKKLVGNRTPSELMEYAKSLGYDYSSLEAFLLSFGLQCSLDCASCLDVFVLELLAEKELKEDYDRVNAIEDEKESQVEWLKLLKKLIGNRTPSELLEYAESLGYDYSSQEAFDLSFELQCKLSYCLAESIVMAIDIIKNREFAGEEDSLALKKKIIDNRSSSELLDYAKDLGCDYSSLAAFNKSFDLHCELYYVSSLEGLNAMSVVAYDEYAEEMERIDGIEVEGEREREILKLYKKILEDRDPKQLVWRADFIKK